MDYKTIQDRTIFLSIVGSHAHGTSLPESDFDEVGVCIPPKDYYFGLKSFKQADKFKNEKGEKIDKVIYSFDKCINLLIQNNPNMMDLLYVPDRCIKIITPEWEKIREIRDLFLSKAVKFKYSGYAYSQIDRLKTHKSYLMNPVSKPVRKDFNLPSRSIFPETMVENIAKLGENFIEVNDQSEFYKEINHNNDFYMMDVLKKYIQDPIKVLIAMNEYKKGQTEFLRTLESISQNYLNEEYRDQAKNEMKYITAYRNWKRYEEWKKNRNPKRQALEAKCCYDSKHLAVCYRILKQGIEILEGKGLRVDRTGIDADYLLEIRLGNLKYDDIMVEVEKMKAQLEVLYETSTLRHTPNRELIEEVKMEILENYLFRK